MLRISKLTDYAFVVMSALAARPDRRQSAADLARSTHLEQPTVSKILKLLSAAGLLESRRGANGGYLLASRPRDISVVQIIESMEGPIGITECTVHAGLCSQEASCLLQSNWRKINRAVYAALSEITLRDMSHPDEPTLSGSPQRLPVAVIDTAEGA